MPDLTQTQFALIAARVDRDSPDFEAVLVRISAWGACGRVPTPEDVDRFCIQEAAYREKREADRGPGGPREPRVYYMKLGSRIKIGTSVDVTRRMGDLGAECVLATEPGSYDLERQRHEQFAQWRVSGEWFRRGKPLLEHIEKLCTG